jgi:hypothetical protein
MHRTIVFPQRMHAKKLRLPALSSAFKHSGKTAGHEESDGAMLRKKVLRTPSHKTAAAAQTGSWSRRFAIVVLALCMHVKYTPALSAITLN